MQRKKKVILILGLIGIAGVTVFYTRFFLQTKKLFGFGQKDAEPTPNNKSTPTDEYRALSKKLMGIPLGYTVLPESVLYAGTVIGEADSATFQDLGASYAKDDKHIYFKGRVVSKADHDSFQVVAKSEDEMSLDFLAEDKNSIFVEDKVLSVSKRDLFIEFYSFPSLRFLNGESGYDSSWAVFDNKLYYYFLDTYGATHSYISLLEGVQPDKVRLLNDIQSQPSGYITDGNEIYFADKKVAGADLDSFSIHEGYARDRKSVYKAGVRLKDADPKTYVVDEDTIYSHDAHHVYYQDKLIEGADLATFQRVDNSYDYSRDKDHVYYRGVRIPAANPEMFTEAGSVCRYGSYAIFGKDNDSVFRNGERVKELDPKTLEIVDEQFVRDTDTILRCGTELVTRIETNVPTSSTGEAKTKENTYREIGNNYETDDQGHYYYFGYEKDGTGKYVMAERLVPDVDDKTFAPLGNMYGWATDKDLVYWKGKVVGSK